MNRDTTKMKRGRQFYRVPGRRTRITTCNSCDTEMSFACSRKIKEAKVTGVEQMVRKPGVQ